MHYESCHSQIICITKLLSIYHPQCASSDVIFCICFAFIWVSEIRFIHSAVLTQEHSDVVLKVLALHTNIKH